MIAFIAIAAASSIGLGIVFWLLKHDTDEASGAVKITAEELSSGIPSPMPEAQPPQKKKLFSFGKAKAPQPTREKKRSKLNLSFLGKLKTFQLKKKDTPPQTTRAFAKDRKKLSFNFLSKLKFGKKAKAANDDIPQATSFYGQDGKLKEALPAGEESSPDNNYDNTPLPLILDPMAGTAAMKTSSADDPALTQKEKESIEKVVEVSSALDELKEKYAYLEQLFKEKGGQLTKAEHDLQNEIKHRKDFNKVKDILEKEIKELKDRAKDLHKQLFDANQQAENYKHAISALEKELVHLQKKKDEAPKTSNAVLPQVMPETPIIAVIDQATPQQIEKKESEKPKDNNTHLSAKEKNEPTILKIIEDQPAPGNVIEPPKDSELPISINGQEHKSHPKPSREGEIIYEDPSEDNSALSEDEERPKLRPDVRDDDEKPPQPTH